MVYNGLQWFAGRRLDQWGQKAAEEWNMRWILLLQLIKLFISFLNNSRIIIIAIVQTVYLFSKQF